MIKMLAPGRVFRSDGDATHSPMFHQMEGLVVDKKITLCDLQGMLDKFGHRRSLEVKLRHVSVRAISRSRKAER